jgi:hypothetical protein
MKKVCGTCRHFCFSEWKEKPRYETSYCRWEDKDVEIEKEGCYYYERSLTNTIKYLLYLWGERRA